MSDTYEHDIKSISKKKNRERTAYFYNNYVGKRSTRHKNVQPSM